MISNFVEEGVLLILVTSCLPLAFCAMNSLLVALIQAATQIQEQTFSYLVRVASICLVIYFFGGWFLEEYVAFFEMSLGSLQYAGKIK